ncbi:MAG: rRNA maturation RNase YbeY [Maribacter sp.]|nr:rRNA maturation RNase YbeY [Maribacter sp.]
MIEFHTEIDFKLDNFDRYADWISRVITSEGFQVGTVSYIFCSDTYLLGLNTKFLEHDTLTDIITFDYSAGNEVAGDIFISIDRVSENAVRYKEDFNDELRRVMVHGILHLMGYNDKIKSEKDRMRAKETEKMRMFHVEQL